MSKEKFNNDYNKTRDKLRQLRKEQAQRKRFLLNSNVALSEKETAAFELSQLTERIIETEDRLKTMKNFRRTCTKTELALYTYYGDIEKLTSNKSNDSITGFNE